MKILKIDIDKSGIAMCIEGYQPLFPAILTIRKLFGTKTIKVYPTTIGPTYGKERVLFFCYVDETGKELPDEISRQINHVCKCLEFENGK